MGVNPASQPFTLEAERAAPATQGGFASEIPGRLLDCEAEGTLFAIVTSGNVDVTIPWNCELIDMTIICTASHASGSIQAKTAGGANVITDAVVCATVKNITRAGQIDTTYSKFAAGGSLRLVTANTPAGRVTLYFKRYQSPNQSNADGT